MCGSSRLAAHNHSLALVAAGLVGTQRDNSPAEVAFGFCGCLNSSIQLGVFFSCSVMRDPWQLLLLPPATAQSQW